MKRSVSTNFLRILLSIMLIVSGIVLVAIVVMIFQDVKSRFTIGSCIMFIFHLVYFLVIYNLRKIVFSTSLTPFCFENVRRFKTIGYSMLVIAVIDAIKKFRIQSGLEIFATKYGSLKGTFFMYFIVACMALVLAEIFEKAVRIKEENDSTI